MPSDHSRAFAERATTEKAIVDGQKRGTGNMIGSV